MLEDEKQNQLNSLQNTDNILESRITWEDIYCQREY